MATAKRKTTKSTTKTRNVRRSARTNVSNKRSNSLLTRIKANNRALAVISIIIFALVGYTVYNSVNAEVRPYGTAVTGVATGNPTWSDEFDGTVLNLNKWQPSWLGSDSGYSNPINTLEANCFNSSQVKVGPSLVSSGTNTLQLKIDRHSNASCNTRQNGRATHVGGIVTTADDKTDFLYGYYEARIYIPAAGTDAANWPAFWTNGDHCGGDCWAKDMELDIMEGLGGTLRWHNHVGDDPNIRSVASPDRMPPMMSSQGGWHTFGVKREQSKLTFYYDGQEYGTATNVVSSPHYVVFNNAINARDVGTSIDKPGSVMEVDYFRFWPLGSGTGSPTTPTPTTNTPPTVSLGNVNSTYTAPATISLTATASDGDGITKVEFYSGSNKLGEDTTSPYSYNWTNVPAGNYSITAKATDTKGASTTSSAKSVSVQQSGTTTPPPSSGGSPAVTFSKLNASYPAGSNVTLNVAASDSDGINRASFYSNDQWFGTDTSAPYSWTMNSLPQGTYKVYVRVTDNVGNTTTTETQTFTVTSSQTPPTGSDTQAPSTPTALSPKLRIVWSRMKYVLDLSWQASSDNVGVKNYVVTRNGSQVGTPTSPLFTDSNMSAGVQYNYSIYAVDAAGNKSGNAVTSAKANCFLLWCSLE